MIGPTTYGFGEHTALLISDIARRRADEPRDAMLFHKLGHIDADHRIVIVEQERSERLRQFSLADARWPKEQE